MYTAPPATTTSSYFFSYLNSHHKIDKQNSYLPSSSSHSFKIFSLLCLHAFNTKMASSIYCYNNDQNSITQESEFSGILDVFVHHARNIHNICIYDNQDVYAKFSLTYNPDDTVSTGIVKGGGKNPDFNEQLAMKVTQTDAVLKCEIWMLSRVRNFLEDQLLGFALVPISMVAAKSKVTQEFTLSSTELFHSPAGTVKLSLSLNTSLPLNSSSCISGNSSITSEVVFLDRNAEYSRIEFPDINIVHQNQQRLSQCLDSFLDLSDDYNENEKESDEKVNSNSNHQQMSVEAEQSAMQQQIVEMYIKSMQQFTESLAKMKLPMEIEKHENEVNKKKMVNETSEKNGEVDKKDGSRVFYGSRAFF